MAISDRSLLTGELRTTIIAAARTTFLLVGIASTAIILASVTVPYSADLLSSSLPRIRTLAFAWLSPSYLFITVHFIIIVIWKLHPHNHHPQEQNEEEIQYLSKESEIPDAVPPTAAAILDSPDSLPDPPDPDPDPPDPVPDTPNSGETDLDESHDSMDATWKAIVTKSATAVEAAAPPRMRKSDTWERCGRDREGSPAATMERKFRKSETFRRISVGREELFGRAEAFIRTHYEQRRIQRQESEQRYIEMVNAAC
ncbi:hypothetical protein IEQ34_026473 [Dendrobium chrysotoxum]|uniref:DUF4408 domain-containing protein n=1 Tax=Dendrobium chrysotoxum TaxID=161865 RepID=A0AAV7FLF0_DENCH|nr:hypothetical protein IEQ34_026473 [Dendrobium chrysotoxum]